MDSDEIWAVIQICLVYPNTESVRSDIERAATFKNGN